jgi:ribosome-binding protein aMBF1 (putative translation factor)
VACGVGLVSSASVASLVAMSQGKPRGEREVDPDAALGAVVAQLRERAAISRAEVAERAELEEQQVAEIEAGRLEPTWGDLRRIAYALEVPLPELLALTEQRLG